MSPGSGTMEIQGSNMIDSPTFVTLRDRSGNALSFTSGALKEIMEDVYWIRPMLTTGAGVNIDVYLCMRSGQV